MHKVIAFVGAGGKTSSILERMDELHKLKRRVVVTTTTHMKMPEKIPEGTDFLTEQIEKAQELLQAGDVVWFGHQAAKGKFCGPDSGEWKRLCDLADVLLVEADGSKRLPVKVPAEHEPVIPENTEQIVIVAGMSGLNQRIKDVCHRLSLVLELLGKEENDVLKEEDYVTLLLKGYIEPLRRKYPACDLEIYLNQVGTPALLEAAERIGKGICRQTDSLPIQYVNYSRALCRTGGDKNVSDNS